MTNPTVPVTPLDVEAWIARLNSEPICDLCHLAALGHDDPSFPCKRTEADVLLAERRALASALPGMGKDSEPTVAEVIAWLQKRPGGSWIATIVDIDIAVKSLRAARTAQPEETSVDERP